METKAIFGILASLFVLLGTIPYLIDIHHKNARPHVLSWLGWSFITFIGASAMMAEGSTWASAIIWANTLACFTIVIYSIIRRAGVWSTTVYDYVFFGLGLIGLVLWQTLNMLVIAIVCAILADLFFGLPTIIKTYKNPASETRLVWVAAATSGFLGLFALRVFSFHEVAYPIYLFMYDTTLLLLVLRIITAKNRNTVS